MIPIKSGILSKPYLWMLALAIPLFSCNKEAEQGIAPIISMVSPIENQSFVVSDTIEIAAVITHPARIDFVSVAVVNENLTTVLPVQEFYPTGTAYTLVTKIIIGNLLLESGKYFIRVKAGFGGQIATGWTEISITAAERVVESILAVCSNQPGEYQLCDIGRNWTTTQRFAFDGDYLGSAINARTMMFYSCGNITGSLNAWSMDDNLLKWTVPAIADPPLPYFTNIYAAGEEVYTATRDAFITGYDASGMSVFKSQLYTNGYFNAMVSYKSSLIAVFEPFNALFNKLIVFNFPGGTFFQSLDFQGSVVKIAEVETDHLLVFMNLDDGSAIYDYQVSENRMVRLKVFPEGPITGVAMSGTSHAFISVQGGIFRYRYADNSLVKYLSAVGVRCMADDYLTNSLYIATDNDIAVYRWPAGTPERTIELPRAVIDLHLRYNK